MRYYFVSSRRIGSKLRDAIIHNGTRGRPKHQAASACTPQLAINNRKWNGAALICDERVVEDWARRSAAPMNNLPR
jgi:hypothetical protein